MHDAVVVAPIRGRATAPTEPAPGSRPSPETSIGRLRPKHGEAEEEKRSHADRRFGNADADATIATSVALVLTCVNQPVTRRVALALRPLWEHVDIDRVFPSRNPSASESVVQSEVAKLTFRSSARGARIADGCGRSRNGLRLHRRPPARWASAVGGSIWRRRRFVSQGLGRTEARRSGMCRVLALHGHQRPTQGSHGLRRRDVLLADQDRSLWDAPAIAEAANCVESVLREGGRRVPDQRQSPACMA